MNSKTLLLALILGTISCHKNNNGPAAPPLTGGNFIQTNIVADTAGYDAAVIDPTLKNAWGLAINPAAGIIWISANHSGATNVYDSTGKTLFGPVPIPSMGVRNGGSPSGVVFNPTNDFVIPGKASPTKFIFANEDGTISAWALGEDTTATVIDKSSFHAVYKGCTIGVQNGSYYLYATNFSEHAIDIYDKNFVEIAGWAFSDPAIPAGYGPFNIAYINGLLYITYAKLKAPDNQDDEAGPGNGYVDIFTTDGKLVKNFASRGALNSPWGIAQAPAGSGLPLHSILIGNFGDGAINVFDSTGIYKGGLQNGSKPVVIDGLWALDFPANEDPKFGPNKLLFTAGPKEEQHGLFGYL
ncbi:MAG TPA: TIGR03118 family protein [Puia sp.]|nr:TIGR03118 family protein [Puia sp.]